MTTAVATQHSAHSEQFFVAVQDAIQDLPYAQIEQLADELAALRTIGGRLFCLGVGGSAANASHMVNDFRKLCDIEAYAPTDNVAELTARVNDEGWDSIFSEWLRLRLDARDALFVLSVGGGTMATSSCLNPALVLAKARGAKIFGITGCAKGDTQTQGDLVIVVPGGRKDKLLTPLAESFQALIWHCLVSHPVLQRRPTKW